MKNIFRKNLVSKFMKKKGKKTKKGKKPKKPKIKKSIAKELKKKNKSELVEKKTGSFSDDEKIEIKKVKKQPTEKRQYNIKDYVKK